MLHIARETCEHPCTVAVDAAIGVAANAVIRRTRLLSEKPIRWIAHSDSITMVLTE